LKPRLSTVAAAQPAQLSATRWYAAPWKAVPSSTRAKVPSPDVPHILPSPVAPPLSAGRCFPAFGPAAGSV
jgi:hypothetical protein